MPFVRGLVDTKQGLLEWVHEVGLEALGEILKDDADSRRILPLDTAQREALARWRHASALDSSRHPPCA